MNRFSLTTDIVYNKKALKDITIIHLSDIHFSVKTTVKFLDRLYNYISKQHPDYIMLTGDLIDTPKITKTSKINELFTFLEKLGTIAPVIISIGNHDIIRDEDFEFFLPVDEIKNVHVLNNKFGEFNELSVFGLTLPNNYYYNVTGQEPTELLLLELEKYDEIWKKHPANKPMILMVHSPLRISEAAVLEKIKKFDLVLSGHTHNGMVPKWLYFMFPKNSGIISPTNSYFPKIAKGKIVKKIDDKKITIIINGAITKLSKLSGKIFSNLNFLYNSSVNKIIIKKEGKNNE